MWAHPLDFPGSNAYIVFNSEFLQTVTTYRP